MITQLATMFGLGRLPKAPGTWGTLAGIPLVLLVSLTGLYLSMVLTLLFIAGAIFVAEVYERTATGHDGSEIVIDEVAGFLVTMIWLPLTWQSLVLGFVLFRLLDAIKPFPINLIDKKVKGGVGVVADDLAAGVIANIALQLIYANTDWLGARL